MPWVLRTKRGGYSLIYGIRGTFLDFQRVVTNLPNIWKDEIRNSALDFRKYKFNLHLNPYLKLLIKDKKGSRTFYDIITATNSGTVPANWTQTLGQLSHEEFKSYCTNLITIKEVKLKDFQFKINHKILVTKTFLYTIKKVDNNLCSYCNHERETIDHLFFSCPLINDFIVSLKIWLRDECNIEIKLQLKQILFSYEKNNDTGNFISLLAKYYIYKSKFRENCTIYLTIPLFKKYLKQKFETKKYIALTNGKLEKFQKVWSVLIAKIN